jgi:glycosyltransferase involved in cell wall biosynthesis
MSDSRDTSPEARGNELTLGVLTDRPFRVVGGAPYGDAATSRLIVELAKRFGPVILAAPEVVGDDPVLTEPLDGAAERFVALPATPSFLAGLRHTRHVHRIIRGLEDCTDVLFIQIPIGTPFALFRQRRPRVYNACADVGAAARAAPQYRGVHRLAAVFGGWLIHLTHRHLVRRRTTHTLTNGDELLRRLHPTVGRSVVSSAVRAAEIGSQPRTRTDGNFEILFVGYLHRYKGLDTLLEAFTLLCAKEPGPRLRLVGPQPAVERGVSQRLDEALRQWPDRIVIEQGQSFGPGLFERYANADVLVVPSLTEGTPRVLVEARAFGCPAVASRVGGIPSSLADGVDGLLVPPGDAAALAAALSSLVQDPAQLDQLRRGARDRAPLFTVERFAGAIADEIDAVGQSG